MLKSDVNKPVLTFKMQHNLEEITLENGAKGLLIDTPGASVLTVEINFRAGEFLVDESKWEIPHVMEHLMLGSNGSYKTAQDFQQDFEKNGAYSNASTSSYDINYEAECAVFEWERSLGLMMGALTKPNFLQNEFVAECGNVREELASRSNNHFRNLSIALRKACGYVAKTDTARIKLIKNIKLNDIESHYMATHYGNNMRFVIGGDLSDKKDKIKGLLSAIPKSQSTRIDLPDENLVVPQKYIFVEKKEVDNLYFILDTFTKINLTQQQSDSLQFVNCLLTETLYSSIFGTARQQGLVYSMGSGVNQSKNYASWWMGAQVMPDNAPKLFDIIVDQIRRLQAGGVLRTEIDQTRSYLLGKYQRSGQTVGSVCAKFTGRYFFDDDIEKYDEMVQRLENVSAASIKEIVNTMLSDKQLAIGFLGADNPGLLENLDKKFRNI